MEGYNDDISLLKSIKNGDRLAFRHLFETYFSPLCRFMHVYIPEQAVVEEVAQDLFLYVWENRETWKSDCLSSLICFRRRVTAV